MKAARNVLIGSVIVIMLSGLSCGKDSITGTNIVEIESYWVKENLPLINKDWALIDMDFMNSNLGWAAGTIGYNDTLPERGIILEYDGAWKEMTLPEVSSHWCLLGVDIVSEYEGWAVGGDLSNSDSVKAVILHYNGVKWNKIYPKGNDEDFQGLLVSVSFGASDEGWTVGNRYVDLGGGYYVKSGMIAKYDDNKWELKSSPVFNGYAIDCGYYSVCFQSRTEGWVSGFNDGFTVQAQLFHERGSGWLLETSLAAGDFYHIQRIVYDSDGGVWGVGQDQIQISNLPPVGMVIQYTPDGWMSLPKFSDPDVPVEFYGIAPLDENNIWVGGGNRNLYLLWFNGEQWHQVKLNEEYGAIRDIIFTSKTEGWAAGIDFTRGYRDGRGIIYYYNEENKPAE